MELLLKLINKKYIEIIKSHQRALEIVKSNSWEIKISFKPIYIMHNEVQNFSQALSLHSNSEKQANKSFSPHESKIMK